MDIDALVFDEEVIGLKFPIKMELRVKEAMEAVKGNTSSGAQKRSHLTGATIMVPMFTNQNDIVSVNTETGEYSERVKSIKKTRSLRTGF